MEPTSEQELKALRDNGDINQADYEQLLEAMQSKRHYGGSAHTPAKRRTKSKILAIVWMFALVFFLAALILAFLQNTPLLLIINLSCVILSGGNALRYWIAYWTVE